MADAAPVVHIGENSPEMIAYKLFHHVVACEGRLLHKSDTGHAADRHYILQTYGDCIRAVKLGQTPSKT